MKPSGHMRIGCFFAVQCLILGILVPPSAADDAPAKTSLDPTPHGIVGITGGVSLYQGWETTVDAASGASSGEHLNAWTQPAFNGGVFADLGFPTSPRGLDGTVGIRAFWGVGVPGIFYETAILARYRFSVNLQRQHLISWDPWFGAGLGFSFQNRIDSDIYVHFPLSLGMDWQLLTPGLYLITQGDLSILNPIGPSSNRIEDGREIWYTSHFYNFSLKVGIGFRFY